MPRPRYFCEHCGAEVGKDARICPRCGHFFTSVRCPRCGYSGKPDDFAFGCPSCGSLAAAKPAPEPPRPLAPAAPPLPWWAYAAALLVLLGIVYLLARALG